MSKGLIYKGDAALVERKKTMAFLPSKDLSERLDVYAQQERLSRSEIIRRALYEYLGKTAA